MTSAFLRTSEKYGDPIREPRGRHRGNVNTIGPRSCYDEGKRFVGTLVTDFGARHGLVTRMDRGFNTYSPHMRLDEGRVVANFAAQTLHLLTSSPLIRINSRDSAVALRKWPSASARRPPFERIWQERTVSQAVHPIAGLYWFIDDIPLRNGLAVAREHDLEVSLRASAARLFSLNEDAAQRRRLLCHTSVCRCSLLLVGKREFCQDVHRSEVERVVGPARADVSAGVFSLGV